MHLQIALNKLRELSCCCCCCHFHFVIVVLFLILGAVFSQLLLIERAASTDIIKLLIAQHKYRQCGRGSGGRGTAAYRKMLGPSHGQLRRQRNSLARSATTQKNPNEIKTNLNRNATEPNRLPRLLSTNWAKSFCWLSYVQREIELRERVKEPERERESEQTGWTLPSKQIAHVLSFNEDRTTRLSSLDCNIPFFLN